MQTFDVFNFDYWIIIKILSLVVLGIYIIFAFVIRRQVKVMTDTLTLGFEAPVKFLSIFHLFFAIFVFVTALAIL
jgi:hypothetical protein